MGFKTFNNWTGEKSRFYCFGEVLFDVFPDAAVPGGAPMNVALHLRKLGQESYVLSKVGNDSNGKELLNFMNALDEAGKTVDTDSNHSTGKVTIRVSEQGNATYTIEQPVAWDFIDYNMELAKKMRKSDIFIFGSLASRSEHSFNSLCKYLETPALKVMDLNLRPPFYTLERLELLMKKSDVLKLNEDELDILIESSGNNSSSIEEKTDFLIDQYNLKGLIVTLGENGAFANFGHKSYTTPGISVEVKDTVGSGDSFLAGFFSKFVEDITIDECLRFGCMIGGFVASNTGANPSYTLEDIQQVLKN